MGLALGGRLLKACLDRGVEPHTSHRGVALIMEDGTVAGVVFDTPEGRKEVHAPNVVIAPAASSTTPSSSARSCAGRAPTQSRSRPIPAMG
jgi:hypothetical protein